MNKRIIIKEESKESQYSGSSENELLNRKRERWNRSEDKLLIEVLEVANKKKVIDLWNYVENEYTQRALANDMAPRNSKQCRERYIYHLSDIKKQQKVPKEDKVKILELNLAHGNKWKEIGAILGYHSDYDIKNCYYNEFRKLVRYILTKVRKYVQIDYKNLYQILNKTPYFAITEELVIEELKLSKNTKLFLMLDKYFYIEHYQYRNDEFIQPEPKEIKLKVNGEYFKVSFNPNKELFNGYEESIVDIDKNIYFERQSFCIEAAYSTMLCSDSFFSY